MKIPAIEHDEEIGTLKDFFTLFVHEMEVGNGYTYKEVKKHSPQDSSGAEE